MKKLKTTPPILISPIPSDAVKVNPALDSTPISAPRDKTLCGILGDNYDLNDPDTAYRIDRILWKLVGLRKNGPELITKDSRNQDATFVGVPKNKSNKSFRNSKDCLV